MIKILKKISLGLLSFVLVIQIGTYFYKVDSNTKKYEISAMTFTDENRFASYSVAMFANRNYAYLSDIPYVAEQSGVGWGEIKLDSNLDANVNGGLITLIVEGQKKIFLKGVTAHATSTLVYDLNGLNYDYFSTYYGVDAGRGTNGNVKFLIYTSVDGKTWNLETPASPKVQTGNTEAGFVTIDMRGKNYIKLYCNSNGSNAADHCAYGNAKLYKEGYSEPEEEQLYDFIKTLDEYDAILKNASYEEILTTKEQVLLQRKFVSNFGYDMLQAQAHLDSDKKETIEWLMNDLSALRYYITGGKPTGTYTNSLNVLTKLYKAHKDDLQDTTETEYTVLGDLYERMMISLSLTHSANVCLWVGGNQCSDAVTRYEVYKKMRSNGLLINKVFETLSIEEMRWVMNNNIDDEEIEWLNHHIRKYPSNWGPYTTDPYQYIAYRNGYNYNLAQYYDSANYEKWNAKYDLSDYNITYQFGKPKLWIVFEQGSVCGGLSKTGSNINGSLGNPSAVIGQPGHAAYLQYSENAEGKGTWSIYNDVGGWTVAEKSERLLAGWGSNNWDSYYNVTYVPYAQDALNDLENYNKALETMILADIYANDVNKLEEIYEKALAYQPYNMDAWYGLIRTYQKNSSKTAEDYIELVKNLADNMYYFPVPMCDLLNLIKPNLDNTKYAATYTNYLRASLEKGTKSGLTIESFVMNPALTRLMANHLLGRNDFKIASFSFDGANAKKIMLGSRYQGNGVRWDYSLDGGTNWIATSESSILLTEEQIATITTENDIQIHIVGVNYNPENIYTIDITKGNISSELYGSDQENRVLGVDLTYEWRMSENDTWTSYAVSSPDLTGDKSVQVRVGATGTRLPSDFSTFTFTTDPNENPARKYVPVSRLSIAGVSSQATSSTQKGNAIYSIDGNPNTRWHSAWNGSDNQKYIIIKFDKPIYLSALEYIPAAGGNGKIMNAKFEGSIDGTNFDIDLGYTSIWGDDKQWGGSRGTRIINWPEAYKEEPIQYLKITGTKTSTAGGGSFIAASLFKIYEDATKVVEPTASIAYSTLTPTNGEVVARLVNFSSPDIVVDGPDTYTFTENNTSYTFHFHDSNTNAAGTAVAKVTWIDKEAPIAEIKYSTINPTSGEVIATLVPNEEITVLNNGFDGNLESGEDKEENPNANPLTYTFMENGSFTFQFVDRAGNIGTSTAKVDWIDKEPIHGTLTYNIENLTNQNVEVKITFDKENVTIKNNGGKDTYIFQENGSFTFEFEDASGNVGTKLAYVNWIDKVAPNVKLTYSTKESTKNPVTVTLTSDEDIIITNNNGNNTYTFEENGSFTFTYKDKLGNKGKVTAKVNWIEKTTKPSTNSNTNNNSNSNSNVSTNTNSNTNSNTTEKRYKDYSLGNIKVSIPKEDILENVILKKNSLNLDTTLKKKFDSNSEYFELYLENDTQGKVNLDASKVKTTIELDTSKEFLGLYEVTNGKELKKLNYKKISNHKIEVETENLGKYVISYKAKKTTDMNTNSSTNTDSNEKAKKSNSFITWLVVGGIVISLGAIITAVCVKKNKEQ